MKLPLTDQFLWELYNFLEKVEEILEPPEIFKLHTMRSAVATPEQRELWQRLEKKRSKRQFAQFVNYLKRKGYIKIATVKEKRAILLTPKAKEKILKIKTKLKNKKERKDKKWIMLMYDIPQAKNRQRILLREVLKNLGYQRFQKSIWVCPYDVLDETKEIIDFYHLNPFAKIFLIEEIPW